GRRVVEHGDRRLRGGRRLAARASPAVAERRRRARAGRQGGRRHGAQLGARRMSGVAVQREYYARTALRYDESHGADEHAVASEALPYPDASFDAVVAIGVMHHVPDPSAVVAELVRVARRAVFISDANIYGAGSPASRIFKLALARTGLLRPLNRVRRGGRDW